MSNGDAFFNGATQVFYNAGVATDNFLDKMCGEPSIDPDNPYGYTEHDLEIMALSDEVKEDRAIARQNSKLQNPYAYTAGRITQMTATTMFAGGMLSSSGLVSEVASFAGGGKLASSLTEVGLETLLVDIPTDTIPEMIANFDSGMSVDEVLKQAGINVLVNTGVNVLGDVVIPGALEGGAKILGDTGVDKALGDATEDTFKAFSDGTEDVLKTSSDAFDSAADSLKIADDALDAGKAIPDVSNTTKVIENGTDVAKVAENGSEVAKVIDNSADAAKVIDNSSDAAKTINNGTDTFKAIGDSTDTAKAVESSADTAKAIDNSSDIAKASEDVEEAGKTTDHVVDAEKAADDIVDTGKTVDDAEKNATDFEKTSEHIDGGNSHETTISDNEYEPGIVVDKYKNFSKDEELKAIPGEAHHTFQDAAFNYVVDTGEAYCVKLDGDLVKSPPGTPHYKFHEYMENWWDQFRAGGDRFLDNPTVIEYSKAAENAYIYAGLDPADAHYAVECSKVQYAQWYTFRKIENEFGDTVGGFTKDERDVILSYIDSSIKGGNLDSFNKPISEFISQDVTDSMFTKVNIEINDQGMNYINYVINKEKVKNIPKKNQFKDGIKGAC